MTSDYCWRGPVTDPEINPLHGETFGYAAGYFAWTQRWSAAASDG